MKTFLLIWILLASLACVAAGAMPFVLKQMNVALDPANVHMLMTVNSVGSICGNTIVLLSTLVLLAKRPHKVVMVQQAPAPAPVQP